MIIKVYESDEFVSKVDNMQRLVYFESSFYEGRDRLDIETFTKECMTKEIVIDSFYTLELISNRRNIRKIVEEDYKEEVEEIEFEILYELKELIETMLLTDMIKFPDTFKNAFRIYEHDWNYFFYVIENEDGYFAYNWSKSEQ